MITQAFNLNLIPSSSPVVVHCDQYDHGIGRLVISLYDMDMAYTPSGTATIQGVKPDGNGFAYNASLSGNTVTANLTEQMTAVAGSVRTQIVVTESSGRTGTFVFILEVQPSALPDDTSMSESEIALIEQAIEAGEIAIEKAAEASASASSAASSASSASASATSASASASTATTKASQAATSASNAATSEANAAISRNTAETKASEASASASAAYNSQTAAHTSEVNANNYQNLAKSYAKGTGGVIRTGDDTDNAEYYASQASGSAASAAAYLDDVEDAAENALDAIQDALSQNIPTFQIDLTTGHLEYQGGSFNFAVNQTNGHLEYELAV